MAISIACIRDELLPIMYDFPGCHLMIDHTQDALVVVRRSDGRRFVIATRKQIDDRSYKAAFCSRLQSIMDGWPWDEMVEWQDGKDRSHDAVAIAACDEIKHRCERVLAELK
jgi:hypothetical protein